MKVSFGSFIPTRVMLDGKIASGEAESEVTELFCKNMRGAKNSQDNSPAQKQQQRFAESVPSYHLNSKDLATGLVKNRNGVEIRYVLTGADAKYWNDMGSLFNRRSEPWKQIDYKGATAPQEPDDEEKKHLVDVAQAKRQDSLNAMVKEHGYKKALIIHAKTIDSNKKRAKDRYEIENIEFPPSKTPGVDFKV